ncbi:hypothetical protein ACCO45_002067 [Purpureocillium lilacinum]|uniref:Uncharacterized protein n=1 Tax=Purpureocillium lilacinum TaxID=33203 RepID=A0ACC4EBQ2_PURLI
MSSKDPHGDDPSKPSKPRDIRPSNASETSIVRGRRGRGARASGLCNVTGPQCLSCPASANGASVRPPLTRLAMCPAANEGGALPIPVSLLDARYAVLDLFLLVLQRSEPRDAILTRRARVCRRATWTSFCPCGCGPDVVGCEHTTAMQWLADVVSPQARRQGQMHESRNKLAISASHWPQSRQRQGHPRAASGRRAP